MANKIAEALAGEKSLKLMTHVVAGYPDLRTSRDLVVAMSEAGADMVEVQIPFSDPLADGPTIMAANQKALTGGATPARCFDLIRDVKSHVPIPILVMTYANIAHTMGVERFISESAECGVSGLIIPDLPVDERNDDYYSRVKDYDLYAISVLSPGMATPRLWSMAKTAEGFIYITLKVGMTGASGSIEPKGLGFIERVRKYASVPLAAGFGISAAAHIRQLKGRVEMAVVGSHLTDLFDSGGTGSVRRFIEECNDAIRDP